jgi:PAS domain-containing protein
MSQPTSILLIEDDFVDQMAFTSLVQNEKLPYQVQIAGSIAEARRLLKACVFDLIITDYQLPDGTSFELIEELRNKLVIFATGAGDEETAARAMHMGVRDYVIKDPERKYMKLLSLQVDSVLRQGRVEQELRESEQRYRELFENASDLIQGVATDGSLRFVNRAWREAFGYTEEETKTLNLKDLIHPSSMSHCLEDGREIILEGSADCHFLDGKPATTRAIFRDVTEKKRAEEKLRKANEELIIARAEVKQLEGLLPICMYCKKIRNEDDTWQEVESYVRQRTEAEFSHGICPCCLDDWTTSYSAGLKTFGARKL